MIYVLEFYFFGSALLKLYKPRARGSTPKVMSCFEGLRALWSRRHADGAASVASKQAAVADRQETRHFRWGIEQILPCPLPRPAHRISRCISVLSFLGGYFKTPQSAHMRENSHLGLLCAWATLFAKQTSVAPSHQEAIDGRRGWCWHVSWMGRP